MKKNILSLLSAMLIGSTMFGQWAKMDSLNPAAPSEPNGGSLFMINQNEGIIYGQDRPGYTIDGGLNWSLSTGTPTNEQLRHIVDNGVNLVGATIKTLVYGGTILQSTTNGQTWNSLSSFNGRLSGLYFTNGTYIVKENLGSSGYNIYTSTDAINWVPKSFINTAQPIGATVSELVVQSQEYLLSPGLNKIWFHFYSTTTQQWDSLDILQSIAKPYTTTIQAITFSDNIGVMLLSNGMIYKSLDGGHTWVQKTSLPLPLDYFNFTTKIEINSQNHLVVFGRFNSGGQHPILVETMDGGNSWVNDLNIFEEPYMSSVTINDLHYFNTNEAIANVFASILSGSYFYIWKKGSTTNIKDKMNTQLISFYPNPSTQYVNVQHVKTNSPYQIYNQLGKLVLEGKTNQQINIEDLTNGIYLLSIEGYAIQKIIKQ